MDVAAIIMGDLQRLRARRQKWAGVMLVAAVVVVGALSAAWGLREDLGSGSTLAALLIFAAAIVVALAFGSGLVITSRRATSYITAGLVVAMGLGMWLVVDLSTEASPGDIWWQECIGCLKAGLVASGLMVVVMLLWSRKLRPPGPRAALLAAVVASAAAAAALHLHCPSCEITHLLASHFTVIIPTAIVTIGIAYFTSARERARQAALDAMADPFEMD